MDTPGGRFFAGWETQAPVTREGQLMLFFEFLHAGERWRELMRECPLSYSANRGTLLPPVDPFSFPGLPQRGYGAQPRVARHELPWVNRGNEIYPNGVVALCGDCAGRDGCNPDGVGGRGIADPR